MARIRIKVKASAKKDGVELLGDGRYRVSVRQPPERGKANQAALQVLSAFLGLPKNRLAIVSGLTSSEKFVEVS